MANNPPLSENPAYLTDQLITYIGNKRSLLGLIEEAMGRVRDRIGHRNLSIFDAFSGSGVTARFFKRFAARLVVNDFERYAHIINSCYLSNSNQIDLPDLKRRHDALNLAIAQRLDEQTPGFISELYAPVDDAHIRAGERVFFTKRNARFIDVARQEIGRVPYDLQAYFLAPLLAEVSVHANTAGVFKGFYKNRETGIGQYGGKKGDALSRIKGNIQLPFPLFSSFDTNVELHCRDANELARDLDTVDLAYLDPPYNQHPYGSNYFMLNLVAEYERPEHVSRVSGIPHNWQRSDYNSSKRAAQTFRDLVASIKSRFVMVSFNSEGFVPRDDMVALLETFGRLEILETKYNTFRASRNLADRPIHLSEYLYLLEKQ